MEHSRVHRARLRRLLTTALVACAFAGTTRAARAQEEEQQLAVRGLEFEGNHALSNELLAASIATSPSSWWRVIGIGPKRYFNEEEFRRDVLRLTLLYRQSGFIDATVDTIVHRSNGEVSVRFLITEGRPVRVTALGITGAQEVADSARLRRRLPLQVGDPFNRLLLQASADTIKLDLANHGYPFAEVFRNFDEDRRNRTAAITFDVDPGPRVWVDSVIVRGTDKVDESVVRHALAIRAGQLFRQSALRESQVALYRTDLFNAAGVALLDSVMPPPGDSTVTIGVDVVEAPLNRARVGLGFGTLDCFRAQNGWTVNDFMGGGRSLQLNFGLSQIGVGSPLDAGFEHTVCRQLVNEDTSRLKLNFSANASLTEPFFLSRRTSATVSLLAERHSEFRAFLREAYGGDFTVKHLLRDDFQASLSYGLSGTRTLAEPAVFCTFFNVCTVADVDAFLDWRRRSTIAVAAVQDRTRNPLDPLEGTRLQLEVRYASQLIGSDALSQFTRATAEFTSYHRTGRRSVFAWRVRVGTVVSPQVGVTGQQVRFVPPEERFYAGGPNSVRGYSQNELGPVVRVATATDTLTSPTGGDALFVANAEWRFPLPIFSGRATGAVFVDAGQVFNRESEQIALRRVRFTPGAGMRIASPLGPVRLDIAFNPYAPVAAPLYDQQTLQVLQAAYQPTVSFLGRFRIHFSVGQAF